MTKIFLALTLFAVPTLTVGQMPVQAPVPKLTPMIALSALDQRAIQQPNQDAQKPQGEGIVVYRVVVNTEGNVIQRSIAKSIPALQPLADAEANQWHFRQVQSHGTPTAWWSYVGVCYSHAWASVQPCSPVEVGKEKNWVATRILVSTQGSASEQNAFAGTPLHRLKRMPLEYPSTAQTARVQGEVKIQMVVNPDGNVADLKAVSGNRFLVEPTVMQLQKWHFAPISFLGYPVSAQVDLSIIYALRHENSPLR